MATGSGYQLVRKGARVGEALPEPDIVISDAQKEVPVIAQRRI
jgi:hypothetical protein